MKRIFIIGCPRSGTTLLHSMLASHPNLEGFTESHFFNKSLWNFKKTFYLPNKNIKENLVNFMKENRFSEDMILQKKYIFQNNMNASQWTKEFTRMMDEYSKSKTSIGWIEKTPPHLYHLRYIEKKVANPIFIHIIREGKHVASSIYDVANNNPDIWGHRTIKQCVDRWNSDLKKSIKWLDSKDNHIAVRYEDLVSRPETTLKKLCRYIDIDWNKSMLEYKTTTKGIIKKHEVWKIHNSDPIKTTNRFDKLTDSQKNYILLNIENDLLKKVPVI